MNETKPSEDKSTRRIMTAIVGVITLVIWLYVFSNFPDTPPTSNTGDVLVPTLAQWAADARDCVITGNVIASKQNLYASVGAPSSIQEAGDNIYLYWDCSDGTVQVVAHRNTFYYQNTVTGRVNMRSIKF